MLRASIIVCTFNRAAVLRETLASIFAQVTPEFEVLLIDDGSTDETPAVAAEFPEVVYIRLETSSSWKNPSHAMNVGIRHAFAPIIIFHSGGVVAESNTIEQLTTAVESNPNVAIFGRVYSDKCELVCAENHRAVFALGAMCRDHFETLRGFDEDFTQYGYEDDDMEQRIREGLKLDVIHDDRIVGRHLAHPRTDTLQGQIEMTSLWGMKKHAVAHGHIDHVRNKDREWGRI